MKLNQILTQSVFPVCELTPLRQLDVGTTILHQTLLSTGHEAMMGKTSLSLRNSLTDTVYRGLWFWQLNWALRVTPPLDIGCSFNFENWMDNAALAATFLSCQRTNGLWVAAAVRGPVSFCPHAVLSVTLSLKLYWTREARASQQCSGHKWNSYPWACDPALYSDFSLHIPVTNVAIKSFQA